MPWDKLKITMNKEKKAAAFTKVLSLMEETEWARDEYGYGFKHPKMGRIFLGLCHFIRRAELEDLLTEEEAKAVLLVVNSAVYEKDTLFLFYPGEREPRIEWLREQVNQLSK